MHPNQERLISSFQPSAYFLLIAADTFIFIKQKKSMKNMLDGHNGDKLLTDLSRL